MKNRYLIYLLACLLSCTVTEPKAVHNLANLYHLKSTDTSTFIFLKNLGHSTLIIKDFTASCDCAKLDFKKGSKIMIGDSLYIGITLFPKADTIVKDVYISFLTNAKPAFVSFSFPR